MNVVLFRPFKDSYRLSMARYADAIEQRVRPWLSASDSLTSLELPNAHLVPWRRRYLDQYVRYGRFARVHAGDVNHVTDHGYGHLVRALPPHRTIVTFHDAVPLKVPGASWRTRLSLRHSLRAMRQAAAIVCVSEAGRRDLHDVMDVPDDRVHVIPWGIDEMFRPPADREDVRRRLRLSGLTVLMVGHTQAYMNVDRMLRAFAMLVKRQGVDATLVKIGLPFTLAQQKLIMDLELNEHVSMVGRVDSVDLPAYYQAADVLLYAPLFAGFGLPPLEAFACGTPVVASNRGAIPEVVGDAALCVDALDEAALAAALADVLTERVLRRRLIEAGFARAGRFVWTDSARRLVALYRTVARA